MSDNKLFNRYDCVYCGWPCDSRDHVVPRCMDYDQGKNAPTNMNNTIPSCRECNSLLGSQFFLNIGDRACYLNDRYKSRYGKLLLMPVWEKNEIEEEEGRLKQYIKSSIEQKESVNTRIKHIQMVMDLCPTIREVWSIINEEDEAIEGNASEERGIIYK